MKIFMKSKSLIGTIVLLLMISIHTGCYFPAPYVGKPLPIVLQFNSLCCGVPNEEGVYETIHELLKENDLSYLNAWKLSPMGKEGEYWICFENSRPLRIIKQELTIQLDSLSRVTHETGYLKLEQSFKINTTALPSQAKWERIVFE
jgi:hypothetical protein